MKNKIEVSNEVSEELIDLTTCVIAAHGFALYLTEQIQQKFKRTWCQKTKLTGNRFIEELEKSVNKIWQQGDKEDLTLVLAEQQASTYELCENFLKISMLAERTLTDEARQIFENEYVELLRKWQLVV